MPSRLITLLLVPLVALVAACGSDAGRPASAGSDVSQLLRDTFSNLAKMKSADVGLQLRLASPSAQGPVTAAVTGPFASTGEGKLPRFAFAATLSAAGRSERVGATWTGEKAFITLQNTSYAVSDLVARQFAAGYQQALRSNQAKQAKGGLLLSSLGIDFTKWLKNARNAGTAQVGDAKTVEITGQADIPRMVGDLGRISQRAQALGVPGTAGAQAQLTPQQKQQLENAIKAVAVQIYTGADDRILRRLVVHAVLHEPNAKGDSTLDLDLRFTNVNGDQRIAAPANPKPFSELLKVTGALGGGGSLGALLGGATGGGAGARAPSRTNVERYAQCVEKAGGDPAKARKCAALLTG